LGKRQQDCGMTFQDDFWILFEDEVLRVRANLVDRSHVGFEVFHSPVLTGDGISKSY
jgi:hypothetical protein